MPTQRRDRMGWWARVVIAGRQVTSRMFPPGRKGGPEWRAAKEWEEAGREKALAEIKILSASERLLAWGEMYLTHVGRSMSKQTLAEKQGVMREFFGFCRENGVQALERIDKPKVYAFLSGVADRRGPNRANVYRKNLLAAWHWGMDFVDGFPPSAAVIEKVRPFPTRPQPRYVPPEEDVVRVLRQAREQDLVFLLTMYFTGARRGELFRLTWEDVDAPGGKIRLTDHKGGLGQQRQRWLAMHPELARALAWWREVRPCRVEHVFMQTQNDAAMGLPFAKRIRFMRTLCERAGVKPFGFHALRHKSAAIVFVGGGLNAAQVLMRHARATTTDIYVRSAGLYTDQGAITDALGSSSIGLAAACLLEKEIPQELDTLEAYCTPDHVHDMIRQQGKRAN